MQEDKGGIGYVDFIFYPMTNQNDDCIILELKVDDTAEHAIQQIKEKKICSRILSQAWRTFKLYGKTACRGDWV